MGHRSPFSRLQRRLSGSPWLIPLAFVLCGVVWGSSFMWIKIAVAEIPPASLVAYRITLGGAAMVAVLALLGRSLPRRRAEWGPLALMGLINTAVPMFLISLSALYVDSGTSAVLNSLAPIFSLLFAGLIIHTEAITALRVGGLVLGFVGASLLASREFALSDDPIVLLGCAAATLAAISYAAGASYARYRLATTDRYVVAAGSLTFAALATWPLALLSDGFVVPVNTITLVAIAWLGLLGVFVAYVLYFFLIARAGATSAIMVTYLFPIVGVVLGVAFLAEHLDWRLTVGTIAVIAGIALAGGTRQQYGHLARRMTTRFRR